MELDTVLSLSNVEILRGIITEKLATAAQEIFAVVQRTVTGYEEEVSGYRREVERQRRQLEEAPLREIKVETDDEQLFPICEPVEEADRGGRGAGFTEDEEQQKFEPSVNSVSVGFCYTEHQVEEPSERSALCPTQELAPEPETPSRSLSPSLQSDRWSAGRPLISESQHHIGLRIYVLDSQINVLSTLVFKKYPLQELQCPRGLQEVDFLNLLRSTFPQLAPDKPFDIFTTDRSKRLQPLTVETLTPERLITSTGSSALYIRLKTVEEPRATDEDFDPSQRKEDPASPRDQSRQHTGSLLPRVWSERRKAGRPRLSEQQGYIDLKIRLVEDSEIGVLSNAVFKKYPLQELQCPRGLQEVDFLNLLRSTFPQLAPDKPFDIFTTDRSKRLQPLTVETLTPEEICRTFMSSKPSTLYIQLKSTKRKGVTNTDLPQEKTLDVVSNNSTSQEEHLREMREAEDGGHESIWSLQSLLLSENEQDVDDDDWEPHKREALRKGETERATKRRRVKPRSTKTRKESGLSVEAWSGNRGTPLSCKSCGALRGSMRMLIKHCWSHVEDAEWLCGVCGVRSASAEELRSHLQSHQKTHSCNICGKSFLSVSGIKGHIARHKGKRPYKCEICHKAFAEKSALTNHKWVHVLDKPYKCDICQKAYTSKFRLKLHEVTHTDTKPFGCTLCRKRLSSFESLSQHMVSHSGRASVQERTFVCEICSKACYTRQRLQLHMRNHGREKRYVCTKCNKGFSCSSVLMTHMRVHTGQKPYKCPACDKSFSQSHCVRRHMMSHQLDNKFADGSENRVCK